MQAFKNIASFLKKYSLIELVKFVVVAGLFVFMAFFLMNFLLIMIIAGFLIRLLAPYFGFKFSKVKFKHNNTRSSHRYKVVGEEEKRRSKK
jgi:ABC-type bacteriocin/lantibiotic exporter with double-glycine peptidase domain